jgi:hypothetical protein
MDGVVPGQRTRGVLQPWPRVLVRRYDGAGAARRVVGVAAPRVIRFVGTDLADPLIISELVQQFGQHLRVTDPATGHFDGSGFQRIRIDPQVNLVPVARLGRPMFLGEPLPFALGFDPWAIGQEVQDTGALAIGDGDVQSFLTAPERAECRHQPIQPGKFQKACDQPSRLPQRQAEQRQTGLNGRVSEDGRTASLPTGLSQPHRLRVKLDRQRPALLEDVVIGSPIRGELGRGLGVCHAQRLTPECHTGNPSRFVQQSPFA